MTDLYYCFLCRAWNVRIEDPKMPENWYVYCENMHPHHAGDVIANSIDQSHKIAGNMAATEAVN